MSKRLLLSVLSVCILLPAAQVNAAASLANKQKELSSITGHIQTIQKTLLHSQSQQQNLQQQLKTTDSKIAELNQQTLDLGHQLLAKEDDIEKIKEQQRSSLADLNHQQKTLTQHLRLIYQLGQTPSLKAFLSPDNIHTTNRHVTYYHYINEARVKLMENIKQTLTELDANMAALGEQEQTLRTLLAVKQQQQQQLVSAKAKRVQIMAQLNKISSSKKVELASLTNSQKNLKTMLVSMEDQDLNLPSLPFKDLQGKLPWPIKTAELPPATPSTDSSGHFSGMIIKVAEGTPVRSIYAGKVIYAKNMPGYGLLVIVNHGDGFMSLYARNHAVFTHVGETVKPGDIIASSGKSGGFSDPSLYFEIRRNGASVDPHNWCV